MKLYDKDFPIFEEYGVQAELDKALRSKVWLKSGGSIVINQTEALVAIDVNTGRYVGKKTAGRLEDTIIKTNLEAAKEIVRQIRLRDLGGIIVCDFIDMEEKKNRQKVFQAVEQELRKDRAPSKALQVSDFGLVIVTRKRVKQSLERVLTEPCPYCSGAGTIKSSATVCYEILSEVKKVGVRPRRSGRAAASESGHRPRAAGRRARRVARFQGHAATGRHRQTGRPFAPRAVRRHVDRRLNRRLEAWRLGLEKMHSAILSPSCKPLGRRHMDQVMDAATIDPDAHVFVALEHLDAGAAGAGAREGVGAGHEVLELRLRDDADDLAAGDLAALHELDPSLHRLSRGPRVRRPGRSGALGRCRPSTACRRPSRCASGARNRARSRRRGPGPAERATAAAKELTSTAINPNFM